MKHGASGYQKQGCRCDICRRGNQSHKQKWRELEAEKTYPRYRNARQWRLQELLAAVPDARTRLTVDSVQWSRALEHGMSDRTADTWAVKCGIHPGSVFTGWFEKGLAPLDDIAINGTATALPGWRNAYVWSEAS